MFIVVREPSSDFNVGVWVSPEGYRYAVLRDLMEMKPGVPFVGPLVAPQDLGGSAIQSFQSFQELVDWVVRDCDERACAAAQAH